MALNETPAQHIITPTGTGGATCSCGQRFSMGATGHGRRYSSGYASLQVANAERHAAAANAAGIPVGSPVMLARTAAGGTYHGAHEGDALTLCGREVVSIEPGTTVADVHCTPCKREAQKAAKRAARR